MRERFGVGRCCCEAPQIDRLTCEIARDTFGDMEAWSESTLDPTVWDITSDSPDWQIIDYPVSNYGNKAAVGAGSVSFVEQHQYDEPCQHIVGAVTIVQEYNAGGLFIQGGDVTLTVHAVQVAGWWPKSFGGHTYYLSKIYMHLVTPDDEAWSWWYSLGATTTLDLCLWQDCEHNLVKAQVTQQFGLSLIYQPDGRVFNRPYLELPWSGSAKYDGGMTADGNGIVFHYVLFNRARQTLDPDCPACFKICTCTSYAADNTMPNTLRLQAVGWMRGVNANGDPLPTCAQQYGYAIGECEDRDDVEFCLVCNDNAAGQWEYWDADAADYVPRYSCPGDGYLSKECVWDWKVGDLNITMPCESGFQGMGWRVTIFDALNNWCDGTNFDIAFPYWNHRRMPIVGGHYYVVVSRPSDYYPSPYFWARDVGTSKPTPLEWSNFEVRTSLPFVYDNGAEQCQDEPTGFCLRTCLGGWVPAPASDEALDLLTIYLSAGGCGGYEL